MSDISKAEVCIRKQCCKMWHNCAIFFFFLPFKKSGSPDLIYFGRFVLNIKNGTTDPKFVEATAINTHIYIRARECIEPYYQNIPKEIFFIYVYWRKYWSESTLICSQFKVLPVLFCFILFHFFLFFVTIFNNSNELI